MIWVFSFIDLKFSNYYNIKFRINYFYEFQKYRFYNYKFIFVDEILFGFKLEEFLFEVFWVEKKKKFILLYWLFLEFLIR